MYVCLQNRIIDKIYKTILVKTESCSFSPKSNTLKNCGRVEVNDPIHPATTENKNWNPIYTYCYLKAINI